MLFVVFRLSTTGDISKLSYICVTIFEISLVVFIPNTMLCGRRGGLMVSVLDSGSSCPGSGPGRGHCVVFLGKTLYSHVASLHPGV